MRSRTLVAAGGLAAAACSILAGAGYALTSETGPAGVRFGAFGDRWVEPAAAVLGTLGGFAILGATLWLLTADQERSRRRAAALGTFLLFCFAGAAVGGLWIWYRADPPLPPSWGWLRVPQGLGILAAIAWRTGAPGVVTRPA